MAGLWLDEWSPGPWIRLLLWLMGLTEMPGLQVLQGMPGLQMLLELLSGPGRQYGCVLPRFELFFGAFGLTWAYANPVLKSPGTVTDVFPFSAAE